MATIWQQPKCCRCKRRFDVKTNDMVPLPDTWQCGQDDCERAPSTATTSRVTARNQEPSKPSKYRNEVTYVDGHRFASKKEANRYGELKLMEKARLIRKLQRQVKFALSVYQSSDGVEVSGDAYVCDYVADFVYLRADGIPVVEDAKGFRTPVFKLKKKLMLACLGIDVVEV